ncbi:hypothetical protein [Streptomyces goshikiensis]|uniref:hypothetical protein n=1 Tax=Streptomyces goshikiensis TaxID=1942 RepID=UPI0033A52CF0
MLKRDDKVMQGSSDGARYLPLVGSTLCLGKSRSSRLEERFQTRNIAESDVTAVAQQSSLGI